MVGLKCKRLRTNFEVIQAEIAGHSDLYLCAVFLTVHDKLTCEVSSVIDLYELLGNPTT
jgi:hypothetical protein